MRLALVGTGAIGSYLLDAIASGAGGPLEIVAIGDVRERAEELERLAARFGCAWYTDAAAVLADRPEIVVEAASPHVVRGFAAGWLAAGVDVLVMSVGALADPTLLAELTRVAAASGRHVFVPSGAVGGLDILRAARIGGLESVQLTTTKPPRALRGAPYLEWHGIDVDGIGRRTVVFEGSASEAVVGFPANLNVVAALSLAGIGPARTRVVLVADPAATRNIHEVRASGSFGELQLRLENLPTPGNPKTSLLAPLSALALLRRLSEAVQVGA